LELEATCPASWTSSQTQAFIYVNASGATAAKFLDEAGLIQLYTGIDSGTGNMVYTHVVTTPGAAAGSIRILVGDTPYYLYYWSTQGAT